MIRYIERKWCFFWGGGDPWQESGVFQLGIWVVNSKVSPIEIKDSLCRNPVPQKKISTCTVRLGGIFCSFPTPCWDLKKYICIYILHLRNRSGLVISQHLVITSSLISLVFISVISTEWQGIIYRDNYPLGSLNQTCVFHFAVVFVGRGRIKHKQTFPYSAKGPWNKSINIIFPTKYVIPKSLKVSHWLCEFQKQPIWNQETSCVSVSYLDFKSFRCLQEDSPTLILPYRKWKMGGERESEDDWLVSNHFPLLMGI